MEAAAFQWVPSIPIQTLSRIIRPLMHFEQVERARDLALKIEKIAEASPQSESAEFIPMRILAARALRDAGLEKQYRKAVAALRPQIEAAPETSRFELSIALVDLVDSGDR